jgi:predicted NAD-dependent protein-ADP-ribosyltransferase YbiA (DUF1768 family)
MDQILFYSPKEVPYGCFSNFSRHSVIYKGRNWKTSEAAFQAMKFYPHRPDLVEAILLAPKPMEAAALGRDPTNPLRADWNQRLEDGSGWEDKLVDDGRGPSRAVELTKDLFMFEVVLAKFTQNHGPRSILLGTGTLPLVENAIHDPYWGIGSSKVGVNRLGKILMLARDHIKNHL